MSWIARVGIIVKLADLVAEIYERDAAGGEGDRIEQQHALYAAGIVRLHPGERGASAGDAAIAGLRIILERHAARAKLPG